MRGAVSIALAYNKVISNYKLLRLWQFGVVSLSVWHPYQRKVLVKDCSFPIDVEIYNFIEGQSFMFLFSFFLIFLFEEGVRGVLYMLWLGARAVLYK